MKKKKKKKKKKNVEIEEMGKTELLRKNELMKMMNKKKEPRVAARTRKLERPERGLTAHIIGTMVVMNELGLILGHSGTDSDILVSTFIP